MSRGQVRLAGWWLLIAVASASACADRALARAAADATGGDPARGPAALRRYGCDGCHTIPGVMTAHGTVGPPLTAIGVRSYVGGELTNTPANMERWIRHPREVEPRTSMPDTGVTRI